MDDDLSYLEPDFDANSLSVPRLRSILVEHQIHYPASAKKPQLVDLFNQHLVPKAKSLLRSRARTTRTTRGIQDVPSSADASVDGEEDVAILPTVEDTPRRSSRKTPSRAASEQVSEATSRASRKSVTQSARSSVDSYPESESTSKPTRRKSQRTFATPIAEEEFDSLVKPEDDGETTFTSDNPFQSGSSPLSLPADSSKDKKRRKTTGTTPSTKKKDPEIRRKTDIPNVGKGSNGALKSSRTSLEVAMPVKEPSDEESEDDAEYGEAFTPEEQVELMKENRKSSGKALVPTSRSKKSSTSKNALKTAPVAILLALLGGIATLWRQEKIQVGYCGIGTPSASIADVEIPSWADVLRPQCEPCPSHAFCYGNLITTCEPDFVLQAHPLSLGGIIPLPPTCEPDGEKARKVKAVADRAVEQLRERNAKWECGELRDEKGRHLQAVELDEPKLKADIASRRRKGMSQEEFEDLWESALPELVSRDEVVSGSSGLSGYRTFKSTSTARIPLICALRRSLRLTLVRNLWKIITLITFIGGAFYARWSLTDRKRLEERAKQLASFALDRLATQASLHLSDPNHVPEAYISMGQLRDDILRDEFSSRERQRLWDRVQKKVENNSNVRPNVRESRSGEVSRVWEWVGAVGQIEDRRQSLPWNRSRISMGEQDENSQFGSSPLKVKSEKENRKWDEGRPIY